MEKKKESIDMETWQNTQDIYIDHPELKQVAPDIAAV
jgi:hypothetical protein